MPSLLDDARIVLVRPKIAGNIGATARAMANMGLSDLVLVSPKADPTDRRARQRAACAEAMLSSVRVVDTLESALNDVHWTVGATCREGRYRRAIEMDPRTLAATTVQRLTEGQRIALVFGPEDHGLERGELLACDATVRIPSQNDYSSLNLASAVMVCAYELYLAAGIPGGYRPVPPKLLRRGRPDLADGETMARMMNKLRDGLVELGYLRPEHPEHLLSAIRAALSRAQLTVTEARILMGLAQQIQEFARYGPKKR
ncbi:MAG: TrmJ/YjtD family RNA methyltransferase [Phycisphaerae bacterium]|nr:TrmJ/YjtD family RNA methyltransferase [Phycisphaerae bacterium]